MTLLPDQIAADPYTGIHQNRNLWFNPAAYAVPALYRPGTAGRNVVRAATVRERWPKRTKPGGQGTGRSSGLVAL